MRGASELISRVTASITFGGSQLILAAATLFNEVRHTSYLLRAGRGADMQEYVPTPWQTCIVYWVSLALSLLINLYFNRSVH